MVEPPSEIGMGGVLEIDNDVGIAVKKAVVKKLIGTVRQAGVEKIGGWIALAPQKAGDIGRRSGAVETMVVIEDADLHRQKKSSPKTFKIASPKAEKQAISDNYF